MKLLKTLTMATVSFVLLSSCSEAQYASHVLKQIPMQGDKGKSAGYYKVGKPYKIAGQRYYPKERFSYSQTGVASWYGPNFHGKMTANGETFDKNELTAAHKTLQLPSIIRVTNLNNGRSLVLRVNDRGPYAHNRVLDVSERAAELLGFKGQGTAKVKIDVMNQASREVASMAKQRIDTTGYEVALNQNKVHTKGNIRYARNNNDNAIRMTKIEPAATQTTAHYATPPSAKPQYEPITKMAIAPPSKVPSVKPQLPHETLKVAGLTPAEVRSLEVYTVPSTKPSNFYIQAGAFSNEQNALNLSNALSPHGNSKVYLSRNNNTPTFRVKLGPYASNEEAASALSALQASGKNGIVIAE